jgi:hypothetical protein
LHHALKLDSLGKCFVSLECDRRDDPAHGTIYARSGAIARMNGRLQYLELGVIGTRKDIANISGSDFVDLRDVVLIGDSVDTDRHKGALDFVAGDGCDDGALIVPIGVDELEEKLEVLRVALVQLDDFVRGLLLGVSHVRAR